MMPAPQNGCFQTDSGHENTAQAYHIAYPTEASPWPCDPLGQSQLTLPTSQTATATIHSSTAPLRRASQATQPPHFSNTITDRFAISCRLITETTPHLLEHAHTVKASTLAGILHA